MSRQRISRAIVPALTVFALVGCGGGAETGEGNAPAQTDAPAAGAATQVADAATLNVVVNFEGTAPTPAKIDMSEEKVCADKHSGGATAEDVVVNGGKLQNVFVYVKEGVQGTHAAPADKVVIDQDGCVYKPHVSGAMVGQTIAFKNSDGILHNVKGKPTANRVFNISQPTNMESGPPQPFATKEVMIPIECNVHSWMKSFIGVLDHPYFAVSGTDGGAKIGNLAPGTYTVAAWHEKYGEQTQSVTVAANESKDVVFNFKAGTANHVPLRKPIDPHGAHTAGTH
jgi:plastocyanin